MWTNREAMFAHPTHAPPSGGPHPNAWMMTYLNKIDTRALLVDEWIETGARIATMSELVVFTYQHPDRAAEVLKHISSIQRENFRNTLVAFLFGGRLRPVSSVHSFGFTGEAGGVRRLGSCWVGCVSGRWRAAAVRVGRS